MQSQYMASVVVHSLSLLGSALPPQACSTISIILIRPWLLCNELGGEMSLDHTRNMCMAKVEWQYSYQGHVLFDQGGQREIVSHPLTALEHYLPES